MNTLEHVLTVVSEEAAEIVKDVCKIQRFGMTSVEPGQNLNNEERLWKEINDLLGAVELLAEITTGSRIQPQQIAAKKARIIEMMALARSAGTLVD